MISHKNSIRLIKVASALIPFRKSRRDFRQHLNKKFRVDYKKNLQVQNYLKQYTELSNEGSTAEKILPKNLPIWQLWLQGAEQAPIIVKKCFNSVKEYSSGRNIVILDENNLLDYIDLPHYILEKKNLELFQTLIFPISFVSAY